MNASKMPATESMAEMDAMENEIALQSNEKIRAKLKIRNGIQIPQELMVVFQEQVEVPSFSMMHFRLIIWRAQLERMEYSNTRGSYNCSKPSLLRE